MNDKLSSQSFGVILKTKTEIAQGITAYCYMASKAKSSSLIGFGRDFRVRTITMETVRLDIFLSIAQLPGNSNHENTKAINQMQKTSSGKQNIVILVLLGFCCLRHHKREIP